MKESGAHDSPCFQKACGGLGLRQIFKIRLVFRMNAIFSVFGQSSQIRDRLWQVLFQGLAMMPVFLWYGSRLDDGNDEWLGLLTLTLAACLIWKERKVLRARAKTRWVGTLLLLISVLGVAFGWPPMIRAVLAVIGVSMIYGLDQRAGLVGLLLLSLPLAASMQFFGAYPLRLLAAEGAVKLLDFAGVVVSRQGTQISLGGEIIGVDPACSGMKMLWHALAAAMALAALHRLSWRATLGIAFFALIFVIPANVLRATVLVVYETGRGPDWMLGHAGIGLLSFGAVLLPLCWVSARQKRSMIELQPASIAGRWEKRMLVGAGLLAPCFLGISPRTVSASSVEKTAEYFCFNGINLPLQPLPMTAPERAFSKGFPGSLASYRWGDSQVILRRVTEATRRLHPSRDCLRAAGFETSDAITVTLSGGSQWSQFYASREGECWIIHERITSDRNDSSWTDVSAWYWSALWHPLNGAWQAETVISQP